MKLMMFSVYDEKAEIYNKPFHFPNMETMKRTMIDLVMKKDNDVGKHPEDYLCFCIGEFDEDTGVLTGIPEKKLCFRFSDLLAETKRAWANEIGPDELEKIETIGARAQ